MATFSIFPLHLCSLILVILLLTSLSLPFSATKATTLPLLFHPIPPHKDPWLNLNILANSSLARAHHLKNPYTKPHPSAKAPSYTHDVGAFYVDVPVGTPSQTIKAIMDTSSSLSWFPCQSPIACVDDCALASMNGSDTLTFDPKLSSSFRDLSCESPICRRVSPVGQFVPCKSDCHGNFINCSETCPPFLLTYRFGVMKGKLITENTLFGNKIILGCTFLSTDQPEAGIIGFGRGPESFPAQVGASFFSYCLKSHSLDQRQIGGSVMWAGPRNAGGIGEGAYDPNPGRPLSYIPFLENPIKSNRFFQSYYYINIRKITVGKTHVVVPASVLVPGPSGFGGTIIDSGATFTYMVREIHDMVAWEFGMQMVQYGARRETKYEYLYGLRPCYNISGLKRVEIPDLVFHFYGGSRMIMPLVADSFAPMHEGGVVCLAILSDDYDPVIPLGPAIILGNYQQQDYFMQFDLKNNRLGFRKMRC